ncbi:MAG: DUF1552 domain-containing protein, partial [Candidatus Limnocylindrales bacterium]
MRLSRRMFLRGASGIAVALPFLVSATRVARAAASPKRLVLFYSANGTIADAWLPTGGATDFVLPEILAPLEPFRDYLNILDGVDDKAAMASQGGGHQTGLGALWTGAELTEDDLFPSGNTGYAGWGGGISIDQHIGEQTHGSSNTKFKTLELGVQVGQKADVNTRMSYLGASQPVPPQDDPKKAFDTLFTELGSDPDAVERLHAERQTVLDAVSADIASLKVRLNPDDRIRLDHHLTAVEEAEKALLADGGQLGGNCQMPITPTIDAYALANFPAVGKLQMDLLHMALACDLTRVASLQWARAGNPIVHSWADPSIHEGHHSLSHQPASDQVSMDKLVKINQWFAKQLAYLCGKLADTPEGDGNMLDGSGSHPERKILCTRQLAG